MDVAEIISRLAAQGPLSVEAIKAARENRAAAVPAFLEVIEACRSPDATQLTLDAGFLIFHLLGEWREKLAYRPLAALLRSPEQAELLLGDGITETSHQVMAAVFDGDPQPLYDIIRDPQADQFVRSRMCDALAVVTLAGELSREEAARFLRTCYSELMPRYDCFVWQGWQSAIALLGLAEMRDLVKQAFDRGFVDPSWLGFHHFEKDLEGAISNSSEFVDSLKREFRLFGDTVEELSDWHCFSEKYLEEVEEREKQREERRQWLFEGDETSRPTRLETLQRIFAPATNPNKHVGRNDPCPCGSGKKYKKCCLQAEPVPIVQTFKPRSAA